MVHKMNPFQYFLYLAFDTVPKKYGKKLKTGVWYDTYHNTGNNTHWALEKSSGTFFERNI